MIAVISDGYEIHKDNQRLRTKGGETIITYGWHRFLYHVGYQFNAHFRKTQEPIWVKKLRFTSTNEAKLLLKYADVIPDDNLVFDKKLQTKILIFSDPQMLKYTCAEPFISKTTNMK